MKIISLGAGVQSSVLALLSDKGELIPRADACIFADTQCEPKSVYETLDWLRSEISIPIHITTAGSLINDVLRGENSSGTKFITIPLYTKEPGSKRDMGRRQCTNEYKLNPIKRKCRELLGYTSNARIPEGTFEVMIGITTDEATRMKPSRVKYIKNIHPLVGLRWDRNQCIKWFRANYPDRKLSKSSCVFCPYRSNESWKDMRENRPDEWIDVVRVDNAVRHMKKGKLNFIHSACKPIEDALHIGDDQRNLFENECEGMCGV